MAFMSCLVRRASSSSPPLLRSLRPCVHFLPIKQFSSEAIDNEVGYMSDFCGWIPPNERYKFPPDFPFEFRPDYVTPAIELRRNYQKEEIFAVAERSYLPAIKGIVTIPVEVHINKGSRGFHFKVEAHPKIVRVRSLYTWDEDSKHLGEFEGCLKNRGINSELINSLSDYLGIKRKNV